MGLQIEFWRKKITEAYYAKNTFLATASDVTSEVINGVIVHIPNAGAASGAQRNRTVLPAATLVQRADQDVLYLLDNFTSDPMLVTDMEQADISYSKMQSMIRQNGAMMLDLAGSAILEYWARNVDLVGTSRIPTTGAGKPIAGLTGTRKKLTAKDLRDAQTKMDVDNVPMDGRYVIITPDMRQDLMEDNDIKNTYTFTAVDYTKGELPMYSGFKIIVRSTVVRLQAAGTTRLPDPNVAVLPTDNFSAIAYQTDSVEYALGDIKLFQKVGEPTLYGDTMSMLLRSGGRCTRADKKGVVLLVQAP